MIHPPAARRLVRQWLLAGLILGSALLAGAADLTGDFTRANQLYEQGRYAEAAEAHGQILRAGLESPGVWFNLGNARLKTGRTGLAILAYRQAQRLAPRDPDIRANLQFARNQAGEGAGRSATILARWLQRLTVDEWSAAASAIFLTWITLLVLGQWQPDFRARLRGTRMVLGLLAGLSITAAAGAYRQQNVDRTAIVIVPEAVIRRGPFNESESAFTVRDGGELAVVDARPDWWLVADATGRSGWVAARQVFLDPPAPSDGHSSIASP